MRKARKKRNNTWNLRWNKSRSRHMTRRRRYDYPDIKRYLINKKKQFTIIINETRWLWWYEWTSSLILRTNFRKSIIIHSSCWNSRILPNHTSSERKKSKFSSESMSRLMMENLWLLCDHLEVENQPS